MPSPTPSPEFFDCVQQGDRAATREFVELYGSVALALLRAGFTRMTEAEREELVQEILLNAIASLPRYDRGKAFKPWFLTIVRRRALDFTRDNADEWMEGDHGKVPTHVSLESAIAPEAPEALKAQVRSAKSTYLAPDAVMEMDEVDLTATKAPKGSLAAKLVVVARWMASLDEREQAILGHYLYGASWEEVAEQLAALSDGITPSTAKVRGHRLIRRAAKELAEELGGS